MNVCIVTEGSYSDYRIVAVFESAPAAQEYVDRHKESSIETWELNSPHNGQLTRSGHEVQLCHGNGPDGWKWRLRDVGKQTWDLSRKSPEIYWGEHPVKWITVLADDYERAVKIAYDTRAELLARDEGIS